MPENENIKFDIPYLDKVVHFMMYFIYTSLLLAENKTQKKSTIAIIVLYSVFFGALMEVLQYKLFTYRSGDIFDMLFNTIGVMIALLLIKKIRTITRPLFPQNRQPRP